MSLVGLLLLLSAVGWGLWRLTRDDQIAAPPKTPARTELAIEPVEPLIKPSAVSNDYLGSAACRECHRAVWERYQSHPMAHSLNLVLDAEQVENYASEMQFVRGKREYRVERTDDSVTHHERRCDDENDVIYDQSVEIRYSLGSGKRGRSYIIDRGGILFLSPISWYSQGHRWDLSPGFPEEGHQRFERRITERCIMCHSGRAAPDREWTDQFQQPAILEFSIGCENCHGPGGGHVGWQKATLQPAGADPIINPAHLDPARRDGICNQCHLQGDAEILRYGRSHFDFRPGMHVGDVWSILISKSALSDGESTKAVSQVQQMQASACARQSGGRLGCISCHDPHYVPKESERPAFYREKCLTCHASADCRESLARRNSATIEDSCIVCHMPRLNAADVPHTSQTDHTIPRRPGVANRDLPERRAAASDDPRIFDIAEAPLDRLEMSRIRGIVLAKMAEEQRTLRLAQRAEQHLDPVWRAAQDDRFTGDALAIVRFLEHRPEQALELWRRLLTTPPVNEETLLSLTIACQQQGLGNEALGYLDRLLVVNPWHARYWNHRRQLLESLGRREEALAAGLKALELDPAMLEAYSPLVELSRQLNRTGQFERLERTKKRLEPSQ